jgi:hypothetical protein
MLRVRAGDRVQVRERCDEGFALTHVRTPPGTVRAVRGLGAGAQVDIELASGQVITYPPTDLELLVPEPAC